MTDITTRLLSMSEAISSPLPHTGCNAMTEDIVNRLRDLNPWGDIGWPEVLKEAADEITALRKRGEELEAALMRQADNMAFIINHHTMHDSWYEKFSRELEEDRAALIPSEQKGDADA